MAHYLDTSALVKLVVAERETPALLAWLEGPEAEVVSSDLARTELFRVVLNRRCGPVGVRALGGDRVAVVHESAEAIGEVDPSALDGVTYTAAPNGRFTRGVWLVRLPR